MEIGMSNELIGTKRMRGTTSSMKIVGVSDEQSLPEIEEPAMKRPKNQEEVANSSNDLGLSI